MSTLSVATIKSLAASTPPAVQDSAGTEVGKFCRAWVNFNGTGTVAIRAAFNVSSIQDDGAGLYRVNIQTAMPDTNYGTNITTCNLTDSTGRTSVGAVRPAIYTTSQVGVHIDSGGTNVDREIINVAIFR